MPELKNDVNEVINDLKSYVSEIKSELKNDVIVRKKE